MCENSPEGSSIACHIWLKRVKQTSATGWTTEFNSLQEQEVYLYGVHTKSGVHPACYPKCTGGSFRVGVKWSVLETDNSPSSMCRIKKKWRNYTSTPP